MLSVPPYDDGVSARTAPEVVETARAAMTDETLLDDALRVVERTGERWFAAELNRHKGQLLRQLHSEAAEELYAGDAPRR